MKYSVCEAARRLVEGAFFITGAGRSGTSLMANLVHSTNNTELIFEPPLLRALFPLISEMNENTWRYLFEHYLFEDHLLDCLAGRRINLNRNDESSIYNAKSEKDIAERLGVSHGRINDLRQAEQSNIAFKLPHQTMYVNKLAEYYPNMKVLVMVRRPDPVVSSFLIKGWYKNEYLHGLPVDWPCLNTKPMEQKVNVPFWVPSASVDELIEMNEKERAIYCYTIMYENLSEKSNVLYVEYEKFTENPVNQFETIMNFFGCTPGALTKQLLNNIQPRNASLTVEFDEVDPMLIERMNNAYESATSLSLAG